VVGRRIREVVVRNPNLRWPVPVDLARTLRGEEVHAIRRRGKYLLFDCREGHLLVHLGMSGRLTMIPESLPPLKHDHVDVRFEGDRAMRLTDPRRFGAMLWLSGPAEAHPLLCGLGPEPFDPECNADSLWRACRRRKAAIKVALMDNHLVVGIGNIYANESLFRAGIRPTTPAFRISRGRWARLVDAFRATLRDAIEKGGSTLRDYVDSRGEPGYFQLDYNVYGRSGLPCRQCGSVIREMRQGGRATYYCPSCQR
jgi:formamidopyrimidine-DNA glycosylase